MPGMPAVSLELVTTMKQYLTNLAMLFAAFSIGTSRTGSGAEPTVAPYGSWRSPITTQMLVQGAVRFGDMSLDGDIPYWVEVRPEEQGRYAIVRRAPNGTIEDVLPPPFSARTLANEYGGGALLASQGTVYFTNYADQRIWRLTPGSSPQPLTPEGRLRFADFVHDAPRNRLIAVCEDHTNGDDEPPNRIVAISLVDGKITTLVEGADFYSNPRVSPDGRQLAWLAWNHPNMPWDDTELFVASFDGEWLARQIAQSGRRSRGVDLSARVVTRWNAVFCFRPHRLVEPVCRARRQYRARSADGGGVRCTAVGVRHSDVRLRARRPHRGAL